MNIIIVVQNLTITWNVCMYCVLVKKSFCAYAKQGSFITAVTKPFILPYLI